MSACQRPSAMKVFVLRPFAARLSMRTFFSSKRFCNCSPQPVSGRLFSALFAAVESPAMKTVTGSLASAAGASRRTARRVKASVKLFTSAELVHDRAVDLHVFELEARDVLDDGGPLDVLEGAVLQAQVVDGRVLEALHVERGAALAALQVLHRDVADDGRELALRALLVVEVDGQHGVRDLPDGDVAEVDVLKETAADGVVLGAQRVVEVGAVERTVFGEEEPDAAGDFAADGDAAVAVLHAAAADDDVLRGDVQTPAVGVAAGLDGDAVVARVEGAVFDEHVLARLGVAAVVVLAVALDVDPADGDVGAEDGVEFPHRRVDDGDALDEHVLAAVGLDELRAEVAAFAEDALADGRAALGQLFERLAGLQLVRHALLPAVSRLTLPEPPVLFVAVAVERALARDGDVLLLEGVDEGRVVHQLHPLPAREDEREVRLRVLTEFNRRAF